MVNKQRIPAILWGLFASATTIIDWYLNAPLRNLPLNEEDLLLYQQFLERPKRALPPPDPLNAWWMVVMAAVSVFFCGYMVAGVGRELYRSRFIVPHELYLKIVALASLIIGSCAGYLLFVGAGVLPTVWKIHCTISTVMATFLFTYAVFSYPYYLFESKP